MNQISKFLSSKNRKKMSNNKPKQLHRKFALKKNIEYSPPSDQPSRARSLDTSIRIQGTNENEFEIICKKLGLSGPEDFAIPIDVWEARKKGCLRSVSDVVLSKKNERDGFKDCNCELGTGCNENGENMKFLGENMGKNDEVISEFISNCDEIGENGGKTRFLRENMGKESVGFSCNLKDIGNSEFSPTCDENGEKTRFLRDNMSKESGFELSRKLKSVGISDAVICDFVNNCDENGEKTRFFRGNLGKESVFESPRKLKDIGNCEFSPTCDENGEKKRFLRENMNKLAIVDNICFSREDMSKESVFGKFNKEVNNEIVRNFDDSCDENNGLFAIEEMETLDRERVLNFSERLQDSIRLNDEMIASPVTSNGKNNEILASSTLVSAQISGKTSSHWSTDDINAKSYCIMDPANRCSTSGGSVRPSIWDFSVGENNSSANVNKNTVVGSIGIKGTRPPVLAPPPSISNRFIDNTSSTWDIMRSFAPDSNKTTPITTPTSARGQNSYSDEEEDRDVRQRGSSTAFLSESYSFTTTSNDDDSSSTTTEPMSNISPNGRFRRVITYWEKGDLLGRGSFGTVYEGIADGGYFIAVKEVSLLDQGDMGRQSIYQLEQEIALLSQFEHENIVQYYGTDKDEAHLYIFLELVTKGSLLSLYQKYRLRDSQVSSYTRQILHGLKYLHERNVVHRDIKCANILVGADGSVKLADFGLAKATKLNDVKSCKGTAFWMAPEVVRGRHQGYGLPADIWSLGCTVLEMLTHRIPYSPLECMQALFRIGRGEPPPIPDSLSRDARDFISRCLKVDPNDRPTAAQLLDHPFVKRRLPNSSGSLSPYHSTGRGLNLS